MLPAEPEPVAVLGIDEARRGRPQWTWNEEHHCWEITVDRWHVGFVDVGGGQGLLGQIEGRTAQTWWPQIEAFLHTGITNATSEGTNRVVKLEARTAYGFRNPVNHRLRPAAPPPGERMNLGSRLACLSAWQPR